MTAGSNEWKNAIEWEKNWWDDCANTHHEEEKQLVYAEKIGLTRKPTPKTPYNFDLNGESVLDIGGGAVSILLKCVNFSEAVVVDPLLDRHPSWVKDRYKAHGIEVISAKGEDIGDMGKVFDSVLIYNVLEHVEDPEKVIRNAQKLGKIIRFFEWIDTKHNERQGHIHSFHRNQFDNWLKGEGKVEMLNKSGCVGKGYFGIFLGDSYAKH